MRATAIGIACMLLLAAGPPLAAQTRSEARFPPQATWRAPAAPPAPVSAAAEVSPAVPFLSSLVLPGSGQALLRRGRWVPFAAAEVWLWTSYLRNRSDARELQREYRDLARTVARRVSTAPERVGSFEYYEALEEHAASGAFDVDERQEGTQPERDAATFNGGVWILAQEIHGTGTPEALAYYEANAITPEFAWAWGENDLEQRVYSELIHRSDEAARSATRALGWVVANHLVSAVDALVAARIRAATGGVDFQSGLLLLDGRAGWSAIVSFPVGGTPSR